MDNAKLARLLGMSGGTEASTTAKATYQPHTRAGRALVALLRRLPDFTQDPKARIMMKAFSVSIDGVIEAIDRTPQAQEVFNDWFSEISQLDD